LSLSHLLLPAALLSLAFAGLWLVQVRLKDASLVDAAWALGLGAMGAWIAASSGGLPARRALVGATAVLWSLRLAAHLYFDRVRGKPEDGRYAALRASWGANANRNFFLFFQAQAALVLILSSAYCAAAARTAPLGPLDALAVLLFAVSLAGESAADRQLAAFRADPANRGRVCRAGLWGWSRHPNYFFEWLVWLSFAAFSPLSPASWLAPALMLFFLLRVTGIPATEAQALKSRGDAYRLYQKEVSMFAPLPPRRSA
jgi:steroid 5-alpha reductase family enzyme